MATTICRTQPQCSHRAPARPHRAQLLLTHDRNRSSIVLRADNGQGATTDASASNSEDFESRIAKLNIKKARAGPKPVAKPEGQTSSGKPDYTNETLWLETGCHAGDLVVNLALGTTLVWLPLTAAAIGRAAFVKYRFTDKRMSVITTAPWKNEQLDASYAQVKDVVSVGRGIGLWGDMVITLKNNDKIELRSVPRWQEIKKYILERRDAMNPDARVASDVELSTKGFL